MQHPFRHFFPGCFPRASHKFRRSRYLIQRFCGNPNTSFNCGSSRTLRTRAMVSAGVCDWSVSTPIISRTANAGRLSLLRFKAERTDDEWNSSRSCRIVADSVVGRKFSHTRLCDSALGHQHCSRLPLSVVGCGLALAHADFLFAAIFAAASAAVIVEALIRLR
jgi:hypothetical protein